MPNNGFVKRLKASVRRVKIAVARQQHFQFRGQRIEYSSCGKFDRIISRCLKGKHKARACAALLKMPQTTSSGRWVATQPPRRTRRGWRIQPSRKAADQSLWIANFNYLMGMPKTSEILNFSRESWWSAYSSESSDLDSATHHNRVQCIPLIRLILVIWQVLWWSQPTDSIYRQK